MKYLYPFVSKSLGHLIVITIGLLLFFTNLGFEDARSESIVFTNIISKYVESETEDILYTETINDKTPAQNYTNGVKANNGLDTNNENIDENTDNNIAYSNDALIKPLIPTLTADEVGGNINLQKYTAQKGDSIGSIAKKFGLSNDTIVWANKLDDNSVIKEGQQLIVPPVDGVVYQIQKGNTLGEIADYYSANLDDIIAYNNLIDAADIQIGEVIIIPDGQKPTIIVENPEPKNNNTNSSKTGTNKPKVAIVKKPAKKSTVAKAKIKNSTITNNQKLGMTWPCGVHQITQYYQYGHSAIDIAGPMNTSIYAAQSGIVAIADATGYNGGYGKTIVIDHRNGVKTRYGHMNRLLVSPGDTVTRGQKIGLMGNTGRVRGRTGIHLHFEVIKKGARINPLSAVK